MIVYLYPARYLYLVSASTLCSKIDFWLVVSPCATFVFQMLLWYPALCGKKTKQDATAKKCFSTCGGEGRWRVVLAGCYIWLHCFCLVCIIVKSRWCWSVAGDSLL